MNGAIRACARAATAVSVAAILLAAGSPAAAEVASDAASPEASESLLGSRLQDGFAKGFDVVILRPLAIGHLIISSEAFVVAAILTSPGGMPALKAAYQTFVEPPAQAAFQRKLGDF